MLRHAHLLLVFLFSTSANPLLSQPAELEGFGAITPGGAGQQIIHVTNLNATGPGSLYAAMGSNRIIVFDVGGTINDFRWDSSEEFAVSFLTIDASTAPSPGITLNNNNNGNCLSFHSNCHDIIVKNIRVRNAGNDGINVVGGYNMVFDHVSVSGSGDGNFDITEGAHNITVQYSILGAGRLSWSGAMLIAYHPTRNISIHHNLFNSRGAISSGEVEKRGSVGERNPLVHSVNNISTENLMADIRNNLIWNWGNTGSSPCCGYGYGTGLDYGGTANIVNNYYQTSGNQADNAIEFNHTSSNSRGYVAGNVSGNNGINPNSVNNLPAPWPIVPVTTQDACTAAIKVLAEAGPRPLDSTDHALVNKIALINCPGSQNQSPVANAGNDITINLPLNFVTLTGSGYDPDGTIMGYAWSRVSGPATFTLGNANTASATLNNLVQGTYVFRLTVTDNNGVTGTDNVTISVQ